MIGDFLGYAVPQIDQYFGVWAMREDVLRSAVERVNSIDLRAHVGDTLAAGGMSNDGRSNGYEMLPGGIAVIDLAGPLMKFAGGSMSAGTSTVNARRQIRDAASNEAVNAILLRIDSPGGTVSGTQDLADEVAAAGAIKPVEAYVEDQAASAAYWVASQASRIVSNSSALVGCIGTYATLVDSSGAAAMKGFKVSVVRAGQFKGMGASGTEITPDHLAEAQRVVDGLNQHFLDGVASGRRMSAEAVSAIADGRIHLAADALKMGLIDGIESFDQTVARMRANMKPVTQPKGKAMSETVSAPVAQPVVTIHELRAACPGADDTFLVGQLTNNATVASASAAWLAEMNARLTASQAEAAALKAEKPSVDKPGVAPIQATGKPAVTDQEESSAIAQWNAAIDAKVRPGVTRQQAAVMVAKENPDLQKAYIEEHRQNAAQRV